MGSKVESLFSSFHLHYKYIVFQGSPVTFYDITGQQQWLQWRHDRLRILIGNLIDASDIQ